MKIAPTLSERTHSPHQLQKRKYAFITANLNLIQVHIYCRIDLCIILENNGGT